MKRTGIDFRRVLLKISGESLAGAPAHHGPRAPDDAPAGSHGIDVERVNGLARELAAVQTAGTQLAVVVGGGNVVRGHQLAAIGVGRVAGDHMGMLATVINALALQDAIETHGVATRVMSSIEMGAVCEPFIRRRCIRHLEKGRIVILAGGTGNPYFTTDTAAALRAAEIGAGILLKGTKVDGVYSADPVIDPEATRFEYLSYREVITRNLGVMDTAAIAMCRDNKLPIIVFKALEEGAVQRVVNGEAVGTLVDAGTTARS